MTQLSAAVLDDVRTGDLAEPTVTTPSLYRHSMAFERHRADDARGQVVVHFRPMDKSDEKRLRAFFATHSAETIYLRYGMMLREMTHERAVQLVTLDGHYEFALVGVIIQKGQERIIAVGRYSVDPQGGPAEVAFVVHEDYRDMGIATHLLYCLSSILWEKDFTTVTAQVLDGNDSMLHAFDEVLGRPSESSYGCGERTLKWRFHDRPTWTSESTAPAS